MKIPLLSHVNADSDILEAWFQHHLHLGISSFHLVVHGPRSENQRLYALAERYPVQIEDAYAGPFDPWEKRDRLNRLLEKFRQRWVAVADSDEFLELPYASVPATVRILDLAGGDALLAPMLQHLSSDGGLDTPEVITDPFSIQPLCSVNLYNLMGCAGDIRKYPLFFNRPGTALFDGGNHNLPTGCLAEATTFRGVTHHFKFRRHVRDRLLSRINSKHPFRGESTDLYAYLERHEMRLPLGDSFLYSRSEMFRRHLLVKQGFRAIAKRLIRTVYRRR